jgi:hypothetical protein
VHPERVVIAKVSTVVVSAVVVAATVGAFRSLFLRHLFPIIQIIIISSGGRP